MRCEGDHVEDEDAALPREALAPPGDGEVLARGSSANKVNSSHESDVTGPLLRCRDVVVLGDVRPMALEDRAGLLVDLDLPHARHARAVEAEVKSRRLLRRWTGIASASGSSRGITSPGRGAKEPAACGVQVAVTRAAEGHVVGHVGETAESFLGIVLTCPYG